MTQHFVENCNRIQSFFYFSDCQICQIFLIFEYRITAKEPKNLIWKTKYKKLIVCEILIWKVLSGNFNAVRLILK